MLIVKTTNPSGLLADIKKAINSKSIQTWSCDSDGDFTHTPEQWQFKGWMSPQVYSNELQFAFVGHKDVKTTKLIYAVYHGRFAEMLLNHFDDSFSRLEATALPASADRITTASK